VVTSDGNGNLATDGGAIFGNLASLNANVGTIFGNLASLNANIAHINKEIGRLDGGVAMAFAMGGAYLPEGRQFAISANLGTFNGQQAIGGGAAVRLADNLVLQGGIAGVPASRQVGGRVGLTASW
jgi:trimeric autotransporter adhesin